MNTLNICLAGAGAFGVKHLEALAKIDGVRVTSLVGRLREPTEEVAKKFGIGHVTTDLAESLARNDVDAVILCTPTQMHASQALACLAAGKHVQVEIPLADRLADAEAVDAAQKRTGLVAMVGHTRRFNPSHQWVHRRIAAGELNVQQMDVQTYFFRRRNINALGPAALVDGPPAVASRGAHRRPVRVAGGGDRRGARDAGSGPPRARHRDGHVDPAPVEDRRRSARCRCRSTTTARSGRSSATSATPARTSRATTTWSTARSRRSTCRRSTCR